MKSLLSELIPRLARGVRPSAAVASGLLAPLAMGAPGDLDPGFADVGRLAQIIDFEGPIWSVEALDDGSIFVAGGEVDRACHSWFCYYDFDLEATNFVSQLTAEGSVDPAFNATRPADIELRDAARQSDGTVIAVGRRLFDAPVTGNRLVVYRLEPGGSLDTTFGVDGIFELSTATYGNRTAADAVILDPDGDIVVAGSRGDELVVLRLLADGTLDESFGEGGVFIGPAYDHDAYLARTAAGGYRVTTSTETSGPACRVIGLTASGTIDTSFGVAGISPVETPLGSAVACYSMEALADDRLLLTGITTGSTFATRLLATGAPDPAFAADAVAGSMTEATALAVADDGKILVAGSGDQGAMIMRLLADGALDPSFGNAGSTPIDLPSGLGSRPLVHDMDVRPDGSVIAAGVDEQTESPFVIRLLGDDGGDSPGVLSVVQSLAEVAEGDPVVLNVRRTGGKAGNVSVAYEMFPGYYYGWPATGGQDYEEISGRLTWADGDTSSREIVVPVHDDTGLAEGQEDFLVALSDAQGGAGIGTGNAVVNILPDGEPAGQLSFDAEELMVHESGGVRIWVHRSYYYEGAVSVTLTPVAGTAAAESDFVAVPVTISWADQEFDSKLVTIAIVDDTAQEGSESFAVELSNPTGGAILGVHTGDTITISANDAPPAPRPDRGGGGGSTGLLTLLLLGFAEFFRALQRRARLLR